MFSFSVYGEAKNKTFYSYITLKSSDFFPRQRREEITVFASGYFKVKSYNTNEFLNKVRMLWQNKKQFKKNPLRQKRKPNARLRPIGAKVPLRQNALNPSPGRNGSWRPCATAIR